jgi:hypothetical protein
MHIVTHSITRLCFWLSQCVLMIGIKIMWIIHRTRIWRKPYITVKNKKSQSEHPRAPSRPVFRGKPEYHGDYSSRGFLFVIKPNYPKLPQDPEDTFFIKERRNRCTYRHIWHLKYLGIFCAYNICNYIRMQPIESRGSYW